MARTANLKWKIEIDTTPLSTPTLAEVKGLESLDFAVENENQSGYFIADGGFGYSDIVAGRLTVGVSGKRIDGDTGQDYLAGLVGSWGADVKSTLTLTNYITGDVYSIPCSVDVTAVSGGAAEELEIFECTFHSDGAWTFTASA
ncbi:MAG: hypothetical protein KAX49_07225 [Halanaerobiales bacterium]|nr:hypothetical protein [Halanaerobiales bacterium]